MDNKLFQNAFYHGIATKALKNKNEKEANEVLANLLEDNTTVDDILEMNFSQFVESNANDIMGTAETGFWKEFIEDDVLIGQLLERVEVSKNLLSKFNFKKMLNGTQSVPVRGKKIRMRLTQESTDTSWSTAKRRRVPTGKMTITATELVVTIPYSDTFAEDSVVNAVTYIMDALYESFENSLTEMLINGDTATGANVNINIIDWNTSALWEDDILAVDWVRKIALSKAVITEVGVLADTDINAWKAKMGTKWINPEDIILAVELNTYFKLNSLWVIKTRDLFWDAATIVNGNLERIYGMEIFPSEELALSLDDGTISATAASNIYWNILWIHVPSVEIHFRRVFTVESDRIPAERTTEVTWSTRVALAINDEQNSKLPTAPAFLLTWITI